MRQGPTVSPSPARPWPCGPPERAAPARFRGRQQQRQVPSPSQAAVFVLSESATMPAVQKTVSEIRSRAEGECHRSPSLGAAPGRLSLAASLSPLYRELSGGRWSCAAPRGGGGMRRGTAPPGWSPTAVCALRQLLNGLRSAHARTVTPITVVSECPLHLQTCRRCSFFVCHLPRSSPCPSAAHSPQLCVCASFFHCSLLLRLSLVPTHLMSPGFPL